jgi:hypothetical protein
MAGVWGTFGDAKKLLIGALILIVLAYFIGYSQGYKAGKEAGTTGTPPGQSRPKA